MASGNTMQIYIAREKAALTDQIEAAAAAAGISVSAWVVAACEARLGRADVAEREPNAKGII